MCLVMAGRRKLGVGVGLTDTHKHIHAQLSTMTGEEDKSLVADTHTHRNTVVGLLAGGNH